MKKIFTTLLCGTMAATAFAQWSPTTMQGERLRPSTEVKQFYKLDLNAIRAQLAEAQETGKNAKPVEIKLPTLDGKIERFEVYSAPVVVKSLADKYQLGSYVGVGIDDPSKYVRFSASPVDLQAMMYVNGQYHFIEPQNQDKTVYGVFPKSNRSDSERAFECTTGEPVLSKAQIDRLYASGNTFSNDVTNFSKNSDKKFRTLRLALSTTGEYTNFFGGVSGALSQINTTLTRVNGVFEKDLAMRVILQDFPELIYTNASTDPYTGNLNVQLQQTLTNTIGNAAYDIGHLFSQGGSGGNAGCIGCVCINPTSSSSTAKGSGYTSLANPTGDVFDIDFVAHEIGHQIGANHTFSHGLEGTGMNVEPGSGSTIMGYAGITSANVQNNSDAYFHHVSINQIQNNMIQKTCDIETATTNNPPVITPMSDVTIPKGTAFVLTAEVSDPEGDPLTYTWEQVDNASSPVTNSNGNNTTGALFRSLMPNQSTTRYFPKLSSVLNGQLSVQSDWETVSNVARVTNFRITVRDNNANIEEQQTQNALQKVTVHANGPFKVLSTKVFNNQPGPFTWDVVGTNAAPFNVANVKIDYTTNNGSTWTTVKESTPNDGSEDLDFAGVATNTQLKVRVSALGNVFYAVGNVTVSEIVACDGTAPAALAVSNVTIDGASVTWDPIADATYILRYKLVSATEWTEVPLTETNYTLTGLEEGSQYEVQVASVCTGNVGTYSASVNFTTLGLDYCTLTSSNSNDEYISNVTVTGDGAGVMSNDSGASNYTSYAADPSKYVTLVRGTTNNTISVSKAWTGTTYNEAITAWIDFNRDGVYEAGEMVLQTAANKDTPVTDTFEVPADAYAGDKTVGMRVVLKFSSPQLQPCGTFSYGEVEDYSVLISPTMAVGDNVKTNVQVFPNPAVDVLNVTKVSANATYTIYDMAGKAVSKGKVENGKVQVSSLVKGVYIITVDNNGETNRVKFIKK